MNSKRRYFKQVRIAQFRAMLELARGKGFAAAAKSLDLATPSVWQQVRALEQEFGVPLIEVNRQQVELTKEGKLLVELATPVVHGFDSLLEQFNEKSGSIPKTLSVASPANILVNELPAPICEYYRKHPDVELKVVDVASDVARQLLENGEVDLAVAGQLGKSFPGHLCADPITSFPFVLACPKGHPILENKRITAKMLIRYPMVMSSVGTNTRTRVDQVFSDAGLLDCRRIVCEASTKDLAIQFVQLGFGLAVVPLSPRYGLNTKTISGGLKSVVLRDVSGLFGHEQIVILRQRQRHETRHQKAFRDIVLKSVG
ncbi:MAG: LysR family transcriptional regulator [Planctomycetales bacterium]|nr:LysR family transcriptional regulator [Planctomycetales bacterium]